MSKHDEWEARQRELKAKRAHEWSRVKGIPWSICRPGCGLVALKNERTRRVMRARCRSWDD